MVMTRSLVIVFRLQYDAVIRYCPYMLREATLHGGTDHSSTHTLLKPSLRFCYFKYSCFIAKRLVPSRLKWWSKRKISRISFMMRAPYVPHIAS